MTKAHFKLNFLILITALISLFIKSGWTYSERETDTMIWTGIKFHPNGFSLLLGILLILCIPTYIILKKKYFNKN